MFLPFPQNLTATAISGTEIGLSWEAASDSLFGNKIPAWETMSIDGYRIERSTTDSDADFRPIAQVTTTNYQDTTVQPGTIYHYQVSAIIGNDYSWKIGASAKTPPAPPPFPTRLTQQQAIQIAREFCQTLNHPVTGPATAAYCVYDDEKAKTVLYWLPRWKVVFEKQAKVDVVDATSAISLYRNNASKDDAEDYRLAGDAIAQDDAIQSAATALLATGQMEDLSSSPVFRDFRRHLLVDWQRQSQGIPYRDQAVVVSLQAETGQVRSISFVFRTAPVADVSIALSQQQAYEIAQNLLARKNITDVERDGAEVEIVRPNSFWQNRSEKPLDTPVRAAWTFQFSGSDSDMYYVYEVWIDAQTGDVIGGCVSLMRKSEEN